MVNPDDLWQHAPTFGQVCAYAASLAALAVVALTFACLISSAVRASCVTWALRLVLRCSATDRTRPCATVSRTSDGHVEIKDLDFTAVLPPASLRSITAGLPVCITAASIDSVALQLPTYASWKFKLSAHGFRLSLKQKALPERADAEARRVEQEAKAQAEARRRLSIVDTLLWNLSEGESSGSDRCGGPLSGIPLFRSPAAVACFHMAVTLGMNACDFSFTETRFDLTQDCTPGPWSCPPGVPRHRDSIVLSVRTASLAPFSPRGSGQTIALAKALAGSSDKPPAAVSASISNRYWSLLRALLPQPVLDVVTVAHLPSKLVLTLEGINIMTRSSIPRIRGPDAASGLSRAGLAKAQAVPASRAGRAESDASPDRGADLDSARSPSARSSATKHSATTQTPPESRAAATSTQDTDDDGGGGAGPAPRGRSATRHTRAESFTDSARDHHSKRQGKGEGASQAAPTAPMYYPWQTEEYILRHWGITCTLISCPPGRHSQRMNTATPAAAAAAKPERKSLAHNDSAMGGLLSVLRLRRNSMKHDSSRNGSTSTILDSHHGQPRGDSRTGANLQSQSSTWPKRDPQRNTSTVFGASTSRATLSTQPTRYRSHTQTAKHRRRRTTASQSFSMSMNARQSTLGQHGQDKRQPRQDQRQRPSSPAPQQASRRPHQHRESSRLESSPPPGSVGDPFADHERSATPLPFEAAQAFNGSGSLGALEEGDESDEEVSHMTDRAELFSDASMPDIVRPDAHEDKLCLHLKVEVRAIAPELSMHAMALLGRVSIRMGAFVFMQDAWSVRPSVSVSENPRAWWRHAAAIVRTKCARLRRKTVSRGVVQHSKLRRKYMRLYALLNSGRETFHQGDLRWWQFWRRRVKRSGTEGEEIEAMEANLSLQDIIFMRVSTALKHSKLLRGIRSYRSQALPVIHALSVNVDSPLPEKLVKILQGREARVPRAADDALICCSASLVMHRIGVTLHQPVSGVNNDRLTVSIALHNVSASLSHNMDVHASVGSLETTLHAPPKHFSSDDAAPLEDFEILVSPCVSVVLLHHANHRDMSCSERRTQESLSMKRPFVSMSFFPAGSAADTATEDEEGLEKRKVPMPIRGRTSLRAPDLPPVPSSPDASASARRARRFATSVATLHKRWQGLTGKDIVGELLVDVAPVELFVGSGVLLSLLQVGVELHTEIQAGEIMFNGMMNCPTGEELIAGGTIDHLIRERLVFHKVAVQDYLPPDVPSTMFTCAGLVMRASMTSVPAHVVPSPETAAAAQPDHLTHSFDPDHYELVLSLVNVRAMLHSKYDITESIACMTYDTEVTLDTEASFKTVELSALLAAVPNNMHVRNLVRENHYCSTLAWVHPDDSDAVLAQWSEFFGKPRNRAMRTEAEDLMRLKELLRKEFGMNPQRDFFPNLPLFKAPGVALRNIFVVAMVPTIAGNYATSTAARLKGILAILAPYQLSLLLRFIDVLTVGAERLQRHTSSANETVSELVVANRQKAQEYSASRPDITPHKSRKMRLHKSLATETNEPSYTRSMNRQNTTASRGKSASKLSNTHHTFALAVPVITVLGFAGRTGPHANCHYSTWVDAVPRRFSTSTDATAWTTLIAPIVDMSIVDLRLGADVQGQSALASSLCIGAFLINDLQRLPSKVTKDGQPTGHPRTIFGPCPARAATIVRQATEQRRYMLGLKPPTSEPQRSSSPAPASGMHKAALSTSGVSPSHNLNLRQAVASTHASFDNVSVLSGSEGHADHMGRYLWNRCRRLYWLQNKSALMLRKQADLRVAAADESKRLVKRATPDALSSPFPIAWEQVFKEVCHVTPRTTPQVRGVVVVHQIKHRQWVGSATGNVSQVAACFDIGDSHSIVSFASLLFQIFVHPTTRPPGESAPKSPRADTPLELAVNNAPGEASEPLAGPKKSGQSSDAAQKGPAVHIRADLNLVVAHVVVWAQRKRFLNVYLRDLVTRTDVHTSPEASSSDAHPMRDPLTSCHRLGHNILIPRNDDLDDVPGVLPPNVMHDISHGAAHFKMSVADLLVNHGIDVLETKEIHRTFFALPSAPPPPPRSHARVSAAGPGNEALEEQSASAMRNRDMAFYMHALQPLDVGEDWVVQFAGVPVVSTQMLSPQLTFKMKTLNDVLFVVDELTKLNDRFFTFHAESNPGTPSTPDSPCSGARSDDPSPEPLSAADIPLHVQVRIVSGSIILPQDSRSNRAIIAVCDDMSVGIPSNALGDPMPPKALLGPEGADDDYVCDSEASLGSLEDLPAPSDVLPTTLGILNRHHAMTVDSVRPAPADSGDGRANNSGRRREPAESSEQGSDRDQDTVASKRAAAKDWIARKFCEVVEPLKQAFQEGGGGAEGEAGGSGAQRENENSDRVADYVGEPAANDAGVAIDMAGGFGSAEPIGSERGRERAPLVGNVAGEASGLLSMLLQGYEVFGCTMHQKRDRGRGLWTHHGAAQARWSKIQASFREGPRRFTWDGAGTPEMAQAAREALEQDNAAQRRDGSRSPSPATADPLRTPNQVDSAVYHYISGVGWQATRRTFHSQIPIFLRAHCASSMALNEDGAFIMGIGTSAAWGVLSPASYWHLMEFFSGNLCEIGSLQGPKAENEKDKARRPYNPAISMWPSVTSSITCMITLHVPCCCLLMQADPRTWESDQPARKVNEAPRVPFALIVSRELGASFVMSNSAKDEMEIFLNADIEKTGTYDLRLARYHLLRQPVKSADEDEATSAFNAASEPNPPAPASGAADVYTANVEPQQSDACPQSGQNATFVDAARKALAARRAEQDRATSLGGDDADGAGGGNLPNTYSMGTPSRTGTGMQQLQETLFPGYTDTDSGDSQDLNFMSEDTLPTLVLADYEAVLLTETDPKCEDYEEALRVFSLLKHLDLEEARRVPLVNIARAPVALTEDATRWASHLEPPKTGPVEHCALSGSFCYLDDGTMAVDVVLRNFQLRWPWLMEMGLLSALLSIFTPDDKQPDTPPPTINPWMYINLVLDRVQVVVPINHDFLVVAELLRAEEAKHDGMPLTPSALVQALSFKELRASGEDGTLPINRRVQLARQRLSHATITDPTLFNMLCQAMLNSLDKEDELMPLHRLQKAAEQDSRTTPEGLVGQMSPFSSIARGGAMLPSPFAHFTPAHELQLVPCMAMQHQALVFTLQAVRYGLFSGDDGITHQLFDLWGAAGHVQHPDACMECFLLPCSLSAEMSDHTARVKEAEQLLVMTKAALRIQRWWRGKRDAQAALENAGRMLLDEDDENSSLDELAHATSMDSQDNASSVTALKSRQRSTQWGYSENGQLCASSTKLIDRLILHKLSHADRIAVQKIIKANRMSSVDLGITLQPTKSNLTVRVRSASLRIAFSHLPVHLLIKDHIGVLLDMPKAPGEREKDSVAEKLRTEVDTKQGDFRQCFYSVCLSVREASLWLCSDGPHSFGAPDVLQFQTSVEEGHVHVAYTEPDDRLSMPYMRAQLRCKAAVRFLDNASSNWDWLLCPWTSTLEYLCQRPADTESDASTLERCAPAQVASVSSTQHALVTFNPACLLTLGDAFSFANSLMSAEPRSWLDPAIGGDLEDGGSGSMRGTPQPSAPSHAPDMAEQMALAKSLLDRRPQRYCIQNHLGVMLWYWAPEHGRPHGTISKAKLEPGGSQSLKVRPTQRTLTMQTADGVPASREHSVIDVLLEGNWLPLSNVIVNQVGKYRYQVYSPHENAAVFVVVDVILVGRTKVISLHAPLWLENSTDLPFDVQLHVPTSLLTVPTDFEDNYVRRGGGAGSSYLGASGIGNSVPATPEAGGGDLSKMPSMVSRGSTNLMTSALAPIRERAPRFGDSGALSSTSSNRGRGRAPPRPLEAMRLRSLAPSAGRYLPLCAMLDSALRISPEGHVGSARDVVRICSDLEQLHTQQGYLRSQGANRNIWALAGAMHDPSNSTPGPHNTTACLLQVSTPTKARNDFGRLSELEQFARDSFRPAASAINASLVVAPTTTLTNALPFPVIITILEVWPASQNPGSPRSPPIASPISPCRSNTSQGDRGPSSKLTFEENLETGIFDDDDCTIINISSVCRASITGPRWTPRLPAPGTLLHDALSSSSCPVHSQLDDLDGRRVTLRICTGGCVNIYADIEHTLLAYVRIPFLKVCSSNWTVLHWNREYAVEYGQRKRRVDGPPLTGKMHLVPYQRRTREEHEHKKEALHKRALHAFTCYQTTRSRLVSQGSVTGPQTTDSPKVRDKNYKKRDRVRGVLRASADNIDKRASAEARRRSGSSGGNEPVRVTEQKRDIEASFSLTTRHSADPVDNWIRGLDGLDLALLRTAFSMWRFAVVRDGQRAPKSLYLGVHNSARGKRGQRVGPHACNVTLFSHYWLANSSSTCLRLWDRPADSNTMGLPDVREFSFMSAPHGVQGFQKDGPGSARTTVLPCLLNRQKNMTFAVTSGYRLDAPRGPFSKFLSIVGVGQKGLSLTGPDFPRPHCPEHSGAARARHGKGRINRSDGAFKPPDAIMEEDEHDGDWSPVNTSQRKAPTLEDSPFHMAAASSSSRRLSAGSSADDLAELPSQHNASARESAAAYATPRSTVGTESFVTVNALDVARLDDVSAENELAPRRDSQRQPGRGSQAISQSLFGSVSGVPQASINDISPITGRLHSLGPSGGGTQPTSDSTERSAIKAEDEDGEATSSTARAAATETRRRAIHVIGSSDAISADVSNTQGLAPLHIMQEPERTASVGTAVVHSESDSERHAGQTGRYGTSSPSEKSVVQGAGTDASGAAAPTSEGATTPPDSRSNQQWSARTSVNMPLPAQIDDWPPVQQALESEDMASDRLTATAPAAAATLDEDRALSSMLSSRQPTHEPSASHASAVSGARASSWRLNEAYSRGSTRPQSTATSIDALPRRVGSSEGPIAEACSTSGSEVSAYSLHASASLLPADDPRSSQPGERASPSDAPTSSVGSYPARALLKAGAERSDEASPFLQSSLAHDEASSAHRHSATLRHGALRPSASTEIQPTAGPSENQPDASASGALMMSSSVSLRPHSGENQLPVPIDSGPAPRPTGSRSLSVAMPPSASSLDQSRESSAPAPPPQQLGSASVRFSEPTSTTSPRPLNKASVRHNSGGKSILSTSNWTGVFQGDGKVSRKYELMMEVSTAMANTCFRHSKIVNVRDKYILENSAGEPLEVKQIQTPDPDVPFGPMPRSACRLEAGATAPLFWDDSSAPPQVVVRLVNSSPGTVWAWSGGFEPAAKEMYFGLRIHRLRMGGRRDSKSVILPVSLSVGEGGVVVISFKSRQNLPPYRIVNACTNVSISVQQDLQATISDASERVKMSVVPETLHPDSDLAFAWDQPMLGHYLLVKAWPRNVDGTFGDDSTKGCVHRRIHIDTLTSEVSVPPLVVQESTSYGSTRQNGGTKHRREGSDDGFQDWKARWEGAIARDSVRHVFVEIFADGPTRVVRFVDKEAASQLDGTAVDIVQRIKIVQERLTRADRRFAALRGDRRMPRLDVFGRALPRAHLQGGGASGANAANSMPRRTATSLAQVPNPNVMQPAAPAPVLDLNQNDNLVEDPGPLIDQLLTAPTTFGHGVRMMLAGDCTVIVNCLRGISGAEHLTHPLVRVRVQGETMMTSVKWQTLEPVWDEPLVFYGLSAASEMLIEAWDLGGQKKTSTDDRHDRNVDMDELLSQSRFLGQVIIPLSTTMRVTDGSPPERRVYVLERRTGTNVVCGSVTITFNWNVTAASLLKSKLAILEKVLLQRTEILSMMSPKSLEIGAAMLDERRQRGQLRRHLGQERAPQGAHRSLKDVFPDDADVRWQLELEPVLLDVTVSVLAVHNVPHRRTFGAAITANENPLPTISISTPCHDAEHWTTPERTTEYAFEKPSRHTFVGVPETAELEIVVADQVTKRSRERKAAAKLPLHAVGMHDPIYLWLPLPLTNRRERKSAPVLRAIAEGTYLMKVAMGLHDGPGRISGGTAAAPGTATSDACLVYVRIQTTPQPRPHIFWSASLNFAGVGFLVASGVDEELLALSAHNLHARLLWGMTEASLTGSVRVFQLDDQSLDAAQPVVLGPAGVVTHGLQRMRTSEGGADGATIAELMPQLDLEPTLRVRIVRSFANYSSRKVTHLAELLRHSGSKPLDSSTNAATLSTGADDPTGVSTVVGDPDVKSSSVISFKELSLELAPLDFTAQESFLVALTSFMIRLPVEDFTQGEAWRRRKNDALRNAAFVRSPFDLSNTWLNSWAQAEAHAAQHSLQWLSDRHNPQGRSDTLLNSWFFIERLRISDINTNVTIALSAKIISTADLLMGQDSDMQGNAAGLAGAGFQLTHFISAAGFQLINVHNVAIQLKGIVFKSQLLNVSSFFATLMRHYTQQGIREAHKVLGGTGPAVAQIPLTVVWAGGTVFDLGRDLATRRVGALSVVPRMGFISLTACSQLLGVVSKSTAALLAVTPYQRGGELSDSNLMQRFIVRPQNAVEAFSMSGRALAQGVAAGFGGVVMDPRIGWQRHRITGVFCGLLKGFMGLGLRPIAGATESMSKATQGAALVCLGRPGIQGRITRRNYAPGTSRRMAIRPEDDMSNEHVRQRHEMLQLWQRSLPLLSEKLRADKISDVLETRPGRVLLLTTQSVAYLAVISRRGETVNYKLRWLLSLSNINNVHGDETTLVISIRATAVMKLSVFGTWRMPTSKLIRTRRLETFERAVASLNNHVTAPTVNRSEDAQDADWVTHTTSSLRIVVAPPLPE